MGSDIYLNWDKQTKEDHEKQITGFSIDAGDSGYLRASIGMIKENQFLRFLIPEKYWYYSDQPEYKKLTKKQKEEFKGYEFDFKDPELNKKLVIGGFMYLNSEFLNIDMPDIKESKDMKEKLKPMLDLFKNNGLEVVEDRDLNFKGAVMWLNSVYNFFELGAEKQEQKLKPKIYISW